MADFSLADVMALQDKDDGVFGNGYGWIILIFLFFLAFGGGFGGFGGNNAAAEFETQKDVLTSSNNTQRDILMTSCNTQKAVQDVNYQTLLGFKDSAMQMASCCLTRIKNLFAGNHNSNVMQVV